MKWVTHEIVTGVVVYAATNDPLLSVCSMAGAIMPDRVEGSPGNTGWTSWRSRHRGWSHWPVIYVLLILLLMGKPPYVVDTLSLGDLRVPGIFICVGALLHIAEDALCGKVPLLLPWQKVGVRLFKVGSFREYLAALVLVLLTYVIKLAAAAAIR